MGTKPWTPRLAHSEHEAQQDGKKDQAWPNSDARGLHCGPPPSQGHLATGVPRGATLLSTMSSRETPWGQKILYPRGTSPGRWACRGSTEKVLCKNYLVMCKLQGHAEQTRALGTRLWGERRLRVKPRAEERTGAGLTAWPRHWGRQEVEGTPALRTGSKQHSGASRMGPGSQDSERERTPCPGTLPAPKSLAFRGFQGRVIR